MYRRISFIFFVLLLPTMCFGDIVIQDKAIHYQGEINASNNAKFIQMVRKVDPQKLIITSSGGAIEDGLALANFIKQKRLSVQISDFCFSSCANYILPASLSFTLADNAVVAWHGGAFQLLEIPAKNSKYLVDLHALKNKTQLHQFLNNNKKNMMLQDLRILENEFNFMKSAGVSSALLVYGQFLQSYQASDEFSMIWSFTDIALKGIFNNFVYNENRDATNELKVKHNIHYFHQFEIHDSPAMLNTWQ